jgi:VanZ family protein
MKRRIQQYLTTKWPAIIWSVIVFALLAMPPVKLGTKPTVEVSGLDKLVHFFLFGLMAWFWGYYQKQFATSRKAYQQQLLLIVTLITIYGIIMEYIQRWVGRDFDVWDMVADAAGASIAGIWLFVKKEGPGRNRGRNQN